MSPVSMSAIATRCSPRIQPHDEALSAIVSGRVIFQSLIRESISSLDGTGDASARALGQLLMSPAQRYLGGPAMRSGMINEIYNQEYNDPKRNPWGAVKKYGEGK